MSFEVFTISAVIAVNRVLVWFGYAAWIVSVQLLVALSVAIANQGASIRP